MQNHKEYGLIGLPLTHSYSEKYFNSMFKAQHVDAEYVNFELPDIGDIVELLAESPQLAGFNVTSPYKELIIPYMTELSGEAKKTGSVNVVKIERDTNNDIVKLLGHNTDYRAFKETLKGLLSQQPLKALILGTGGAARSVSAALDDLNIAWSMVSRNPGENLLGYDSLAHCINDFTIIINATPLGTYPHVDECPPLPFEQLSARHLCYDMVYNPPVTRFMRECAAQGAAVKNGLEMLKLQAQYSWEIWNS